MQDDQTPTPEPVMGSDMEPEVESGMAPAVEPVLEPVLEPGMGAKEKNLKQLAQARKSAACKKRKLTDDMESVSAKLDLLVSAIQSSMAGTQPESPPPEPTIAEPPQKRIRVTRVDEEEMTSNIEGGNTWGTTILRNVGLASLAAGSYYLQHVYGKPTPKPAVLPTSQQKRQKVYHPTQIQPTKTTIHKRPIAPVLPVDTRVPVGKSGFMV
jgi:hypothetical protein